LKEEFSLSTDEALQIYQELGKFHLSKRDSLFVKMYAKGGDDRETAIDVTYSHLSKPDRITRKVSLLKDPIIQAAILDYQSCREFQPEDVFQGLVSLAINPYTNDNARAGAYDKLAKLFGMYDTPLMSKKEKLKIAESQQLELLCLGTGIVPEIIYDSAKQEYKVVQSKSVDPDWDFE